MAVNNRVMTRIKHQAAGEARKIAEYIAAEINLSAPVDKDRHPSHRGKRRLAGSFKVKMNGDEAVIVTNQAYWIYVEKGVPSRGQPPQPFVARAVDAANARYHR